MKKLLTLSIFAALCGVAMSQNVYNASAGTGGGGSATLDSSLTTTTTFDYAVVIEGNEGMKAGVTTDPEFGYITADSSYIAKAKKGAYRHLRATAVDSAVVIDIAAQDTWYQITNASDSIFRYIEHNDQFLVSGDTIIYNDPALSTAHYDWVVQIGGTGATGILYRVRIYNVTDATVIGEAKKEFPATGSDDMITVFGYDMSADHGDEVIIQIANTEGTQDFTFTEGFIKSEYNHE